MEETPKETPKNEDLLQTVRTSPLIPDVDVYERLRQLRGKIRFSRTWEELKEDR